MGLYRFLHKKLNLLLLILNLPKDIRKRADKYFNKSKSEFRLKHNKKPNRDELFLLVVKSSHRALGVKKASGKKGHYNRQLIRKYLLLKNNIRDKYKIQEGSY